MADPGAPSLAQRTEELLGPFEVWCYDDLPMAWSSHTIEYRSLARQGNDAASLEASFLADMAKAVECGASAVAFRVRPQTEIRQRDCGVYARFHLLPAEANDKFWALVSAKPEGAPVPEVVNG